MRAVLIKLVPLKLICVNFDNTSILSIKKAFYLINQKKTNQLLKKSLLADLICFFFFFLLKIKQMYLVKNLFKIVSKERINSILQTEIMSNAGWQF